MTVDGPLAVVGGRRVKGDGVTGSNPLDDDCQCAQ